MTTEFNQRNIAMTVRRVGYRKNKVVASAVNKAKKGACQFIQTEKNILDLALTVEVTSVKLVKTRNRSKCPVGRAKQYLPFFVLEGEPHERRDVWTDFHEWKKGRCIHCKVLAKDAYVMRPDKRSSSRKVSTEGKRRTKCPVTVGSHKWEDGHCKHCHIALEDVYQKKLPKLSKHLRRKM